MKIKINSNEAYIIDKEEIELIDLVRITETLKKVFKVKKIDANSNIIYGPSVRGEKCIYCDSTNTTKRGWRYNMYGRVQKYQCQDCGKKFSNSPNKRMRYPETARIFAAKLRKEGKSYSQVANAIQKKFKIKLSRQTVHRWFKK